MAAARAVLLAAADGLSVDAEGLAFEVLASHPDELVRLAAAVFAADAHRGRRAVELAAAVIETARAAEDGGGDQPGQEALEPFEAADGRD